MIASVGREMSNTKKNIRVMISDTFDPWFNMAIEDWIFQHLDPTQAVLYLWRNQNVVYIGRFQNPWTECNTQKMEEDGIKLARRKSGGGAVFHDLGNTCFTFLNSKSDYDKTRNNRIITNAISKFGLSSFTSGRNDILVSTPDGDKKISGSAFKETKDRAFHHGTLLINLDVNKLANYLNPNIKKLQSKGITSVRARVANLQDLNPEINNDALSKEIIAEFFKEYEQECEVEYLNHNSVAEIPELRKAYEFFSDWNWRFGESPQFNHQMTERFDWGMMEVHLNVHKAHVEEVKIFSDSLHPEMIELLNDSLFNIPYTPEAFGKAIEKVSLELPMISDYLIEFKEWITKEIK